MALGDQTRGYLERKKAEILAALDPATVPTYYPFTRLEQDGTIKGTIEATVKVME